MNSDESLNHTRQCVDYYRKLGLCPLPSRMDVKGPLLPSYAQHYGDTPVPDWVYRKWNTTNCQIITGAKSPTMTKVIVVDLDGPEASEAWDRIVRHHGGIDTGWVSVTGSGGHHIWFTLPDDVIECQSGLIWGLYDTWGNDHENSGRGGWCKHKEIRILADNALVVAPPSFHVDAGVQYKFSCGPKEKYLPNVAPNWLLNIQRLASPRFTATVNTARTPVKFERLSGKHYTREEVIAAVGEEKFRIATQEWGLVSTVFSPNANGWCPCYVPGREDPRYSKPSGSFHFHDGTLQDRKTMESISFFDLSVILGVYRTWQECRDALGDRFIGKRS